MLALLRRYFTPTFFALIICGCSWAESGGPKTDEPLKISVQQQATTCGKLVESQWLSNQQQYEKTFQAMFQSLISDSKPQPKTVDFERYAMLLVSMGQQRTGGYAIKLASDVLQVENNRAIITVSWISATPGMAAIQMLTNPCLLLQVPRANYMTIDIVDQKGKLRLSIDAE